PVALVLTEQLEPASGPSGIIFPPSYAPKDKNAEATREHPYPISKLHHGIEPEDAAARGIESNVCDLDSVGAQSNRMEPIFKRAPLNALVPQITINDGELAISLLEAGHRIADGAVRYSKFSSKSVEAIKLFGATGSAIALAKVAPTSLVFGFWDSRDSQLKHPRVLSSTIRATNVATLKRSAQYKAAPLKLDEHERVELSEEGFNDIPAVGTHGGVRVFGKIVRKTEINLVALRSLAAVTEMKIVDETATLNLRRYLLGLALVAARAQNAYNLRQGCLLVQKSDAPPQAQLVYPSGKRETFTWDLAESFAFAQKAAEEFGVGESGEFAFEPTRVKEALKGKKDEKAAKKATKKATI
ncbi:MAG: type I-G CRISPR-associated RAMP protein Csb1/Cas7g, partial [Opitutaceae bacterium]